LGAALNHMTHGLEERDRVKELFGRLRSSHFLNNYFSEMVEAVFDQSGIPRQIHGDGLMAAFGPSAICRTIQINGDRSMLGKPPIDVGIGLPTDEVIVGNIGSRRRLEYIVIGDGVNTGSRVQAVNKDFGTTILITLTTYEAVKDEFECRLMPGRNCGVSLTR